MSTPHERLKQARIAAGYKTTTAAANALGINPPTYVHHENGTSGLSRAGERYARFFRVNLEWLLTGRGQMKDKPSSVRIMGYVGAGAVIDPIANLADQEFPEDISLPLGDEADALIVKGDSQWPRFMDGEVILVKIKNNRIPIDTNNRISIISPIHRETPMIRTEPICPAPPAFIPRADLIDAADIRRRMVQDLGAAPGLADPDAPITTAHFRARGWTLAQIAAHGPAAIERFLAARAADRAM